jgi:hypothetical protein
MYVEEEHNGSDDDKDADNNDDGIEDSNDDDWDDAYLYLGPNISKSFTICGCSLTTAAANRR